MTAKLIDGTKIATEILLGIKNKVKDMKVKPGLAVVLVGKNPASQIYVGKKEQMCKDVGFYSEKHELDENIDDIKLLGLVDELNQSTKIHGMLVQLPLPKHIDERLIIDAIVPHKDADGFNPINMGNMLIGNNMILPATPKGMMKLIESTGVKLEGKHAVVVGRSNIVGKPIAVLLQQKNVTVTMCHSRTKSLEKHTKKADILVVATGKAKMITADMVKEGALVIDVGMNRDEKGKLCGDVDFEGVKMVASYITPVPGGVGPMTIACLLENTLECMELNSRL
jgi:methylenetetrahydrofolate dehydrogenase (NADP+)/methenyltetrahydrofolate cyclohydrolase